VNESINILGRYVYVVEVMEHGKTNEKIAEVEEKEDPRKGKDLSFDWRAPTERRSRDCIIIVGKKKAHNPEDCK